jgi:hypothetical protein
VLALVGVAMVNLPDELARRLEAEAAWRALSIDLVAAELVAAGLGADTALESFIGSGRSGGSEPIDVRSLRAEVAERRLADGTTTCVRPRRHRRCPRRPRPNARRG